MYLANFLCDSLKGGTWRLSGRREARVPNQAITLNYDLNKLSFY